MKTDRGPFLRPSRKVIWDETLNRSSAMIDGDDFLFYFWRYEQREEERRFRSKVLSICTRQLFFCSNERVQKKRKIKNIK